MVLLRIEYIEEHLADASTPFEGALVRRMQRLKGLLMWTLETEYHERLTLFDQNLRTLDEAIRNGLSLDFPEAAAPRTPGVMKLDVDVASLRMLIDWTPFFQAWELRGSYPRILDDASVGAQARLWREEMKIRLPIATGVAALTWYFVSQGWEAITRPWVGSRMARPSPLNTAR